MSKAQELRENVARAIWNVMREYEDRCDMELEDMGKTHHVWEMANAAISASSEQQAAQQDVEFELWQDDMVVASVFGPREQSVAEIMRYAEQYAQDGEVRIEEVIRIPFDAARASNGGKA